MVQDINRIKTIWKVSDINKDVDKLILSITDNVYEI